MKIGCCTSARNYEILCGIGYDFIELSAQEMVMLSSNDINNLKQLMSLRKVPCIGFNDYSGGFPSFVGPNYDKKAVEAYAEKVCQIGSELGIQFIGIGSPIARRLPANFDKALADEQIREFLIVTSGIAAKYNINVLFEAVHEGLCNYINYTSEAFNLVNELSISNLFLLVDLYHMEVMGESTEQLREIIQWVKHIHISHRGEKNERLYLTMQDSKLCSNLINKLKAYGYSGTLSIEADTESFSKDAQDSFNMLKPLI